VNPSSDQLKNVQNIYCLKLQEECNSKYFISLADVKPAILGVGTCGENSCD